MKATLGNTFQGWSEARRTLDHAIQHYLDYTIALRSDLRGYDVSGSTGTMQSALPEGWLDDIQVPIGYSKLAHAQTHLDQIYNSFLRINTLPLEILLKTFRFSALRSLHTQYDTSIPNPYQQENEKDLIVLTHVCTHWRAILLNEQSFWSRFEFNVQEDPVVAGERARAYLGRAPDALLSFYFHYRTTYSLGPIGCHPLTIAEHFEARFDRLARLTLMSFERAYSPARDIILFWLKNGKPGTLRTLTIQMEWDSCHNEVINTKQLSISRERADSLLAPIRILYLNGLRFDWGSPAYYNLVVLRIGGFSSECSPHIHEMLAILSACPQLHTLALFNMWIGPGNLGNIEPVHLTELEHLSLTGVSDEGICLILPAIILQSQHLTFQLSLPGTGEEVASDLIRSFLARTNITRIYIQHWQLAFTHSYNLSWYLSALPNLHTLIVYAKLPEGWDTSVSDITRLDEWKGPGTDTPLCPQLRTIYSIYRCRWFPTSAIQQIAETHHIRKLKLLNYNINTSEEELGCQLRSFVEDVSFDTIDEAGLFDWYELLD